MKLFHVETAHDEAYDALVSLLRDGSVVAIPTDTSYGLAADPFNDAAISRLFSIKGRPETKPILLLVDSLAMADALIELPDVFHKVAGKFWPGQLTLIAHATPTLPPRVTAGTGTIGLRWPVAPFATALVSRFGGPITATSANRSGMPSTVTADEVRLQLGETIDALVDGGLLPTRSGSTVLDVTMDPPVVLREGPVTFEQLDEFLQGRIRRQTA